MIWLWLPWVNIPDDDLFAQEDFPSPDPFLIVVANQIEELEFRIQKSPRQPNYGYNNLKYYFFEDYRSEGFGFKI